MAGETLSLPGSPEITKKDSYNPRRNSTGESNLKKGKEKIVPIYLRASTGSCHDFCKYGKGHVTEEKPRRPMLKRVSMKSNGDKIVSSLELQQGKRLSNVSVNVIKQRGTKCPSDTAVVTDLRGNASDVFKREARNRTLSESRNRGKNMTSVVKAKKIPLPVSETNPSKPEELKFLNGSSSSRRVEAFSSARNSLRYQDTDGKAKRTTSLEQKSVLGKLSVPSSERVNVMGTRKKIEISKKDPNKVLKNPLRASLSSRAFPDATGKLNVRNKAGSSNAVPSLKNQKQVKTQEARESNCELKLEKDCSVDEKTLYVIKMETENVILESDQNESCVLGSQTENAILESDQNKRCVLGSQTDDAILESDQNEICVLGSPCSVESSQDPSFSVPLPELSSSSHDTDDHQEKIECKVTEAEDGFSESSEKSDFTVTEGEADESFSENSETMEDNNNKSQLENNSFSSNDTKSKTLYIKKGKALDHDLEDNSTPRRLKFRRGRILGEALTKKLEGRRSFKRRGADFDADESKPGSEKVVLRHQDVQGKKDSIVFNNVIEETASKLVETRKSKVKALVGAFETVISLQEKNPSGGTAA